MPQMETELLFTRIEGRINIFIIVHLMQGIVLNDMGERKK